MNHGNKTWLGNVEIHTKCIAKWCDQPSVKDFLFCKDHWPSVPKRIQHITFDKDILDEERKRLYWMIKRAQKAGLNVKILDTCKPSTDRSKRHLDKEDKVTYQFTVRNAEGDIHVSIE